MIPLLSKEGPPNLQVHKVILSPECERASASVKMCKAGWAPRVAAWLTVNSFPEYFLFPDLIIAPSNVSITVFFLFLSLARDVHNVEKSPGEWKLRYRGAWKIEQYEDVVNWI